MEDFEIGDVIRMNKPKSHMHGQWGVIKSRSDRPDTYLVDFFSLKMAYVILHKKHMEPMYKSMFDEVCEKEKSEPTPCAFFADGYIKDEPALAFSAHSLGECLDTLMKEVDQVIDTPNAVVLYGGKRYRLKVDIAEDG